MEANAIGAARMGVLMSDVKVVKPYATGIRMEERTEEFGEASVDGLHVGVGESEFSR